MQILKNRKIDKNILDKKINYIEKYHNILASLNEGKTYRDIAKDNRTTIPAIQYRLKRCFDEIENIEPNIKDLYINFDTFLNLKNVVDKEWVFVVARLIVNKIPNSFQSTIDMACIVDIKLKHLQSEMKFKDRKPYTTVTGDFLKELGHQTPCRLEDYAKEKDINPRKFEEMINVLFFEKICLINGWILSTRKSLLKTMILYGSDERINYEGTLSELFDMFFAKYKKMFIDLKIKNYVDFINRLKKDINLFGVFVALESENKEYETRRFLQKCGLKEYRKFGKNKIVDIK